jgi:hypothetical protein
MTYRIMMYEGISEEEREEAADRCDADMVVAVIENEFLKSDFNEVGLCRQRIRMGLLCRRGRGWAGWDWSGSSSRATLASGVTGLDFS